MLGPHRGPHGTAANTKLRGPTGPGLGARPRTLAELQGRFRAPSLGAGRSWRAAAVKDLKTRHATAAPRRAPRPSYAGPASRRLHLPRLARRAPRPPGRRPRPRPAPSAGLRCLRPLDSGVLLDFRRRSAASACASNQRLRHVRQALLIIAFITVKNMEPETEGPAPIVQVTPLQQMIASCTGAVLTSLMVTPLDVVKIRLQAQNNPFPKGKCFLYSNGLMDHMCICEEESKKAWYKKPGNFHGTVDAFLKILRNEGIKSLWSGLPPTLVMAIPATVIYFTCYEQLSAFLKAKLGENETRIPIVAGVVARFGAVTVISPLELIRTKVQSKKFSYKELYRFVSQKVSEDGWISLWKGWAPTILRDVPFSAMYWYNYENLKRWLCEKSGSYEPTFMITFTSGALSGSFAAVATLPFDVVKTQKQTQLWTRDYCKLPEPLDMSTWTIMKNIVADKGFSGLFTGLIPRLVKIVPACAIMISSYELGKSFFQKQNVKSQ